MSRELPTECPFTEKCLKADLNFEGIITFGPTAQEERAKLKSDLELAEDCARENLGACQMFRLATKLAQKDKAQRVLEKQLEARNN